MMSSWRLVLASLKYHWRINTAVVLGVAAAAAVLTGALLVGDSVRGSLRGLTLDRLGKIDALLVTDRFFRREMATELSQREEFARRYSAAVPALLFPHGTFEHRQGDQLSRASRVLVLGCDAAFWELDRKGIRPAVLPAADEVVLNQPLADELQARVGDEVTLRLPAAENAIPAESPLGDKENRVRGIPRLKVVAVLPVDGLGRFSLTPSQSLPHVAFLAAETLERPLQLAGRANAVLVAGDPAAPPPDADDCRQLSRWLRPTFADYGLVIRRTRVPFQPTEPGNPQVVLDYFSLTSDRMLIDDASAAVASLAFSDRAQRVFTYLANAISRPEDPEHGVPYSTVCAVDSAAGLGPLIDAQGQPIGPLSDDEVVLNSWTASALGVRPEDKIRLYYFEPETTHGREVEVHRDFTLKSIVPLTEPQGVWRAGSPPNFLTAPTPANDYGLTPEVKGITDQDSIENWDTPFPLTRKVEARDEDYYDRHRLTPKAFVSLAAGQQLWGSRFGRVTSFRIPAPSDLSLAETESFITGLEEQFLNQVAASDVSLGFEFQPIKLQGLQAASGTTPFDGLFLALSFFIIAAALMLVSLLFRLGVEQRAAEIGLLQALGLRSRTTSRLLLAEGGLLAALGAGLGVALGVAYADLMLVALRTVWRGAIGTPFLQFHGSVLSLGLGYLLGVIVCVLTILVSLWRMRRVSVSRLLGGRATESADVGGRSQRRQGRYAIGLLVVAVGLAILATQLGGESQAGSFVGAGVAVLAALLLLIRSRLGREQGSQAVGQMTLSRLAFDNAGRNPGRSTLTIGLIATASFLIVALSSFRLDPTREGAGGFDLVADSSQPLFADLNEAEARCELLASRAGDLDGSTVVSCRVQPGDDASCTNLFKASRPQVLGVTPGMIRYFDSPQAGSFSWAKSAAETPAEQANPWRLLEKPAAGNVVPVVIDKNTAMFSLGMYRGVGEEKSFDYGGGPVTFRVVGLLSNSILQGNLLIGESDFRRLFSHVSGYQYLLIKTPPGKSARVAEALEQTFGDEGLDTRPTRDVLENLLAVQNTYLSTFQSLGALGLLLGTFGLATVQLRNVFERRAELALFRAVGFRQIRLGRLVLLESLLLLATGLAVGVGAAGLAVIPHMLLGQAAIAPAELARDVGWMLGAVVLVGLVVSRLAVRATLRAPLISALRGD